MPVWGDFFEGEDVSLKTETGQPILTSQRSSISCPISKRSSKRRGEPQGGRAPGFLPTGPCRTETVPPPAPPDPLRSGNARRKRKRKPRVFSSNAHDQEKGTGKWTASGRQPPYPTMCTKRAGADAIRAMRRAPGIVRDEPPHRAGTEAREERRAGSRLDSRAHRSSTFTSSIPTTWRAHPKRPSPIGHGMVVAACLGGRHDQSSLGFLAGTSDEARCSFAPSERFNFFAAQPRHHRGMSKAAIAFADPRPRRARSPSPDQRPSAGFNDRIFINNASLGAYAASWRRERSDLRTAGAEAGSPPTGRSSSRCSLLYRSLKLTVTVDGERPSRSVRPWRCLRGAPLPVARIRARGARRDRGGQARALVSHPTTTAAVLFCGGRSRYCSGQSSPVPTTGSSPATKSSSRPHPRTTRLPHDGERDVMKSPYRVEHPSRRRHGRRARRHRRSGMTRLVLIADLHFGREDLGVVSELLTAIKAARADVRRRRGATSCSGRDGRSSCRPAPSSAKSRGPVFAVPGNQTISRSSTSARGC